MRVTIAGYLTDHRSRVLLQQTDERSLAPVRLALSPGLNPAEALTAAFRRATGLIVMPVRLVGVYYTGGADELALCYRCTLRGGNLEPPEGQPAAGFFDTRPLPDGLDRAQARQLDEALRHAGGPATTARLDGRAAQLWRRARPLPRGSADEADWTATARLVWVAGGAIAWARPDGTGPWRLPAAPVATGQAPWEAAARQRDALGLAGPVSLRLIMPDATQAALSFVFVGRSPGAARPGGAALRWAVAGASADGDAGDAAVAVRALAGPDETAVVA